MLKLKRVLAISALLALSVSGAARAAEFAGAKSVRVGQIVAQSQALVSYGPFQNVEHPTKGSARVIAENGKRYLVLSSDFKTDPGPALEVIFYRGDRVPLNIGEGSYVSLGKLQKVAGTQRYLIPDNVNLGDFGAIAVWCQQFNATFGYAALQR